jgi:hypothetical protein
MSDHDNNITGTEMEPTILYAESPTGAPTEMEPTVIHVKGTGKEVGFHVPRTFAEFEASRPTTAAGIPLRTAVKTGMRNGYASIYESVIVPITEGLVDNGSLAANETVIGLRFMEMDSGPDGDNILAQARPPKGGAINALTVGKCIRSILDEGLEFAPRSMVAVGPKERRE